MSLKPGNEEQEATLDVLPQCWNDRRLLEHDPLKGVFMLLELDNGYAGQKIGLSTIIRQNIKHTSNDTFCKAFIRWGLVTFKREFGETSTFIPKADDIGTNPLFWSLFVKVFDMLHSSNPGAEQQAREEVNQCRKRFGYSVELPESAPIDLSTLPFNKTHLLLPDLDLLNEINFASKKLMQLISQEEGLEVFAQRRSGRATRLPQPPQLDTFSEQQKKKKKPKVKKAQTKKMNAGKETGVVKNDKRIISLDSLVSEVNDSIIITCESEVVRQISPGSQRLGQADVMHSYDTPRYHENTSLPPLRTNHDQLQDHPVLKADTSPFRSPPRPHSLSHDHLSFQGPPKTQAGSLSSSFSASKYDMTQPTHFQAESAPCNSQLSLSVPTQESVSSRKSKERKRTICHECRRQRKGCDRMRPACKNCVLRRKNCRYDDEPKRQIENADTKTTIEDESVSARQKKRPRVQTEDCRDTYPPKKCKLLKKVTTVTQDLAAYTLSTAVESPVSESSGGTLVDIEDGSKTSLVRKEAVHENEPPSPEKQAMMELSIDSTRPHFYLPKPALPKGMRPRIWAASRQALCETTTWFRCYHGGVYFSDGRVYGYLLGGYSSQRDVFCHDGRLIISHGGGKSLEGSIGQRDRDSSVRGLLYNYKNQLPLVLLADNKYAHFPFDLEGVMYVVLGYYWIVDAWGETDVIEGDDKFENRRKLETRIRYKFAFQYCEGQGTPWWLEQTSAYKDHFAAPQTRASNTETNPRIERTHIGYPRSEGRLVDSSLLNQGYMASVCNRCKKSSPRPYTKGWMCFNPDCAEFCKFNSEEVLVLDYDKQFLALRTDPGFGNMDISLPSPLVGSAKPDADSLYSTKGWWCPKCGQLCPREKWECWECPDCKISFPNNYKMALPIRSISDLRLRDLTPVGQGTYGIYRINRGSGITVSHKKWSTPCGTEAGIEYIFELPEKRGRIHLISGNTAVNRRANGLFRHYQEEARDKSFLRRYPLRSHHARGRMLTNYFSHNAGAPYKYAVTTNNTVPFDQAPDCVNAALRLISDRVSLIIKDFSDFNEILSCAYMEEQRMSYHSDDEKGLGPLVASLSLGSVAHMHFRQHKTLTNTNPEHQFSLVLRHGDVLAMNGALIQKYYDHSAVPLGFRIAATARYIDPTP